MVKRKEKRFVSRSVVSKNVRTDRYNVTRAAAYSPTPVLWLRVGTVYDRPRNGLLIARIGSRPITQPSGQKLNNGLHLPIVVETLEGTWTHHSLLDIDVVNVFILQFK